VINLSVIPGERGTREGREPSQRVRALNDSFALADASALGSRLRENDADSFFKKVAVKAE
jgi:hypothetical protein